MKLWSSEHVFSHPFKQVTEAAWRKYPNEQNTNVVAIDVTDRKVLNDGRLLTTRIFGSHWNLPKVITALFGMPEMCYAVEHSEVDLKKERMILKMFNYTFWGILACEETLVYEPNRNNRSETLLNQSAKISVNGIQFSNYFEGVIASNFESTSKKGRFALETVLNKIKVENMLDTLHTEIKDLATEIDRATAKFDSEYHVTERLQSVTEDLDHVTSFINSELSSVSNKIKSEFDSLVNKLDNEINQISIEIKAKCEGGTAKESLTTAVQKAGITVVKGSS